jgi:hypothetical protein
MGFCLIAPSRAGAQDSSKVIAMENLWNRAELNNDAPAVRLLLADDFVMTVAEGTLYNKSQIVASVADKSYRPEALQSSNMVVHSYGTTAVVTGAYYEKGSGQGQALGATRPFHRYLDDPGGALAMHSQPLQRQAEVSPGGRGRLAREVYAVS